MASPIKPKWCWIRSDFAEEVSILNVDKQKSITSGPKTEECNGTVLS